MKTLVAITAVLMLVSCSVEREEKVARGPIAIVNGPALPVAISNNAVAGIETKSGLELFTFMGIESGRTRSDITSSAWHLPANGQTWTALADVPGQEGRLASAAVAANGDIYVFGGYTVAEDGTEKSTETVFRLNLDNLVWDELAPMPVPVDDAVALVYQDRYVYLISGWHDLGNVNLVQIYDAIDDTWTQGTPWPGEAVFGHAGGIVGNRMVVCDGVAVRPPASGDRTFEAVSACYAGVIDADNRRRIDWNRFDHHPGPALFRMAAAGSNDNRGEIVFAGGSDNPYNYDGIGYNGVTSTASSRVFSWRFSDSRWYQYGDLEVATMDHRALVAHGQNYYLIGGMRDGPQVSDALLEFTLPIADE